MNFSTSLVVEQPALRNHFNLLHTQDEVSQQNEGYFRFTEQIEVVEERSDQEKRPPSRDLNY